MLRDLNDTPDYICSMNLHLLVNPSTIRPSEADNFSAMKENPPAPVVYLSGDYAGAIGMS
jgi:hypothetical protein